MNSTLLDQEFLNKIGITALPTEEQEKVLSTMQEVIFQAIMLRALDELDEAKQAELEKVISEDPSSDQEAAFRFINDNVPYIGLIASEEIDKFKYDTLKFLSTPSEAEKAAPA